MPLPCRRLRPKFRGILAGLVLCISLGPARGGDLPGIVARVIDGDRLVLRGPDRVQRTIRLAGIDAPEPGQPYAERAQGVLTEHLTGRFVVVDFYGEDAQGQILGRVSLGSVDINLAQIGRGLAWADPQTLSLLSPVEQRRYAEAEWMARRAGRGLWREQHAIAPWVWRDPAIQRPPETGLERDELPQE